MARISVSPGREVTIESLPPEITQRFLGFCDPVDASAFAQTSRDNYGFVYNTYDQVLWREWYLELFDDPRQTDPATAKLWDRTSKLNLWRTQLCERIRARQVLRGLTRRLIATVEEAGGNTDPDNIDIDVVEFDVVDDEQAFVDAIRVMVQVLDTARLNPDPNSVNLASTSTFYPEARDSKNIRWIESVLDHPLIRKLVWDHPPAAAKQDAAKLHVHYGMSDWDLTTVRGRGLARERVYLLSNYHQRNRWGPYFPDYSRRPNWEQLEAMMIVVGRNANERAAEWGLPEGDMPRMGIWNARNHTMPLPPIRAGPKAPEIVHGDWAGVTGKWYRVVCFMDYRDLWGYNYGDFLSYNPDFLATYQEAVRNMSFNLKIVSIGSPPEDIGIRGANVRTPPPLDPVARMNMRGGYFPPSDRDDEEGDSASDDDEDEDEEINSEEAATTRALLAELSESGQLSWLSQRILSSSSVSPLPANGLSGSPSSSNSSTSPQSLFGSSLNSSTNTSLSASSSRRTTMSQEYPPIYFTGSVRSSDAWHPVSYVHGRVERGEDGTVYWKLTSNYDGQDRWVSEGVQIGGMQSRMGVLGIWSDAFHEHEGPAGPFWFWKGSSP